MDYSSYSFSPTTQAEFYKAETEVLRLGSRITHSSYARYMKATFLAIDGIFAIRMTCDVELPVVPLITIFDLADRKYQGDTTRCLDACWSELDLPDESYDAAVQALHYMQALEWVSLTAKPGFTATIDTVLHLHETLLYGKASDDRYHGFRSSFLPHKKGLDPNLIPVEISNLCQFCNDDYFSPIGQASVIHHAFESIVPFDSMIDRTGLLFAFIPMFRRELLVDGYVVPICWGASLEKDYRKKLKDSSRDTSSPETHLLYRERWAAYNARNTYMAVVIANSFLSKAGQLRAKWESQGFKIPANSAIDRLLDLFLAIPHLSIKSAAKIIGKSYGATNEAMSQLVRAGIVEESALDGRERVFICKQSEAMITKFVHKLIEMSQQAEPGNLQDTMAGS